MICTAPRRRTGTAAKRLPSYDYVVGSDTTRRDAMPLYSSRVCGRGLCGRLVNDAPSLSFYVVSAAESHRVRRDLANGGGKGEGCAQAVESGALLQL